MRLNLAMTKKAKKLQGTQGGNGAGAADRSFRSERRVSRSRPPGRGGRSARLPVRLALLGEGARSLDGVLGPPHPVGFRVAELEGDVQGMAEAHQRRLLAGADGQGRALQDLVGPFER